MHTIRIPVLIHKHTRITGHLLLERFYSYFIFLTNLETAVTMAMHTTSHPCFQCKSSQMDFMWVHLVNQTNGFNVADGMRRLQKQQLSHHEQKSEFTQIICRDCDYLHNENMQNSKWPVCILSQIVVYIILPEVVTAHIFLSPEIRREWGKKKVWLAAFSL